MIIAVDFDGTIVTHEYPKIGKEIPFAIDTLKRIQNDFQHRLILWKPKGWSFTQLIIITPKRATTSKRLEN